MVRIWRAVERLTSRPAAGAIEEAGHADREAEDRRRKGTTSGRPSRMLERDGGATIQDIQDATRWLAHTVRGFLSIARCPRGAGAPHQ